MVGGAIKLIFLNLFYKNLKMKNLNCSVHLCPNKIRSIYVSMNICSCSKVFCDQHKNDHFANCKVKNVPLVIPFTVIDKVEKI